MALLRPIDQRLLDPEHGADDADAVCCRASGGRPSSLGDNVDSLRQHVAGHIALLLSKSVSSRRIIV